MQRAVERDLENCSNYAMCVFNPSRIGKSFDDAHSARLSMGSRRRLGSSYKSSTLTSKDNDTCAPESSSPSKCSQSSWIILRTEKVDISKLVVKFSLDTVKEMLANIAQASFEKVQEKKKAEGFIKLVSLLKQRDNISTYSEFVFDASCTSSKFYEKHKNATGIRGVLCSQ
ncbi:3-oxoacyl-[acyl-carrier-protein] synthase [Serendipita sp. 407]|nr:3-oxoacyl-[acyl-carrier-protein] synthase [Serendipita sp. 407]